MLHNHLEGSLLDGYSRASRAAKRAREIGLPALAVTDHNEVNQHPAFQKACRAEGIHPILGIEADWVYNVQETRQLYPRVTPKNRSHICLLAENNQGLSNIWALSSLAYTDEYRHYKPLVTPELMRQYREGIYASDGCMLTEFGKAIEAGDENLARKHFAVLLDIFGDHFYSELHTWQFIEADTDEKRRLNNLMRDINQAKVRFATEMGVPLVVVNDSHHSYPEDWENKELVWQFNTGQHRRGDQENNDSGQKADHIMDYRENAYWLERHGIPNDIAIEAHEQALEIAERCHAEIVRTLEMPRLTETDAEDLQLLIKNCGAGFKKKVVGLGLPEELYFNRMEEELELIASKNFAGYFNIRKDEVDAAISGRWAPYVRPDSPEIPMLVGPGRGSAGGCLVAYLLGITALDPIHYDLLFERFLDPGRSDYPDIDIDFPQTHKPDIKHYKEVRHGHDHVCSIGTLSRSQPKAMLRDIARAMKIPLNDVAAMSKIIEQVTEVEQEVDEGGGITWDEVVEKKGGDLHKWATQYPELFKKVGEMSGTVRQSGVHASGVVVSNKSLLGNIPFRVRKGQLITQLDMYEVEELGAVKLDDLGLRHLDTLMYARNLVYERHGVWLDFRDDQIPAMIRGHRILDFPYRGAAGTTAKAFAYEDYADPAIWTQIEQGHTLGIFQLETPDLTRHSMMLKPRNEVDVAALISIVRPGVKDAGLGQVYLDRRAGKIPVEYDHPMMEPITRETYGVLVFQEQLLTAVKQLAGFTPVEANALRRALGKKKMEQVLEFRDKFVQGCLSNRAYVGDCPRTPGSGEAIADRIWASIEASGRYAFNKSHAVGYALIGTWEVWVKHYYPIEFITALMATDGENINRYVREARRLGFKVLPPDVNLSEDKFTIEGDNAIRYGTDAIKGIGDAAAKEILANRPFDGPVDMAVRCDSKKVGKGTIESLISLGAFDSWFNGDTADLTLPCVLDNRRGLMEMYHDQRIFEKAAPSVQAKLNRLVESGEDPLAKVNHIAAWREKHKDKPAYKTEFSIPDFSNAQRIYEIENELCGNHILIDPMAPYEEAISSNCIADPAEIDGYEKKEEFNIGGQVTQIKPYKIKKEGRNKNREMCWLTVRFNELDFEITIFPDNWLAYRDLVRVGVPVMCAVKRDDRGCSLIELVRLDYLRRGK